MAPKRRVIIDTDPGVDDVLALLLALSAHPDELEVVMISVTYGNVELQCCLRNVVAMFHVLEKELAWRKAEGRKEGYEGLKTFKPIVAIGAEHPLEDELLMADHFHGADGLHGVHDTHPHLSPSDTWRTLFAGTPASSPIEPPEIPSYSNFFVPSRLQAHEQILQILRDSPEGSVTIVAIGPLTNLALAAAADTATFLRVRELVVMGGAVGVPGNITPVAEFNTYADSVATARVFALTSPTPSSTMPPPPPPPSPDSNDGKCSKITALGPYPEPLPGPPLKLTLFPLDVTTPHLLNKSFFSSRIAPNVEAGSPLATWVATFLGRTFDKVEAIEGPDPYGTGEPGLSLHDPMTIWYLLTPDDPRWRAAVPLSAGGEDIRVETSGQWTRGMHVIDRRVRRKPGDGGNNAGASSLSRVETHPTDPLDAVTFDDIPGDTLGWLSARKGNRINRIVGSPGEEVFAEHLMERLFD